jgi:hypothetical protein
MSMRKAWKALALAGVATLTAQFGLISALQAQTTGDGATTGGGATTGVTPTTRVATTGVVTPPAPAAPIVAQPRFTG